MNHFTLTNPKTQGFTPNLSNQVKTTQLSQQIALTQAAIALLLAQVGDDIDNLTRIIQAMKEASQ